jgi:hypothetical protein
MQSLHCAINSSGKVKSPGYLTSTGTDIFSALNELTIHVSLTKHYNTVPVNEDLSLSLSLSLYIYIHIYIHDRLCGLVVRVPGYRSRGPGSILGATRFYEK